MTKTAVVYTSKYGSTKRYAQWLAQDTGSALLEGASVTPAVLASYDAFVYCGGVYAGRINGLAGFLKKLPKHFGGKLLVVAVGTALPSEENARALRRQNLPAPQYETVPLFLLRGALDYRRMHLADKLLMWGFVRMLRAKKPHERSEEETSILETYGGAVDYTSRTSTAPVVEAVQQWH